MTNREYDSTSAASIFAFSKGLLHKSLAQAVIAIDPTINAKDIVMKGKGGLGQLVEKYYYGYEPNSDPRPDFPEAGVELDVKSVVWGKRVGYRGDRGGRRLH